MRLRLGASRTGTAAQTPMGVGRTTVTVIPERRGESDFLSLLLGGFFLAGSLRGFSNQPWLAVVGFAISAAIFSFWIWQRMKPAFALTIGPDEIVWGRPGDERRAVIARDETGWVRIEPNPNDHHKYLIARDGHEDVAIILVSGFNSLAVAEACEAHGWPVSMTTKEGDFSAAPQVAARPRPRPMAAGKAMSKAQRILMGTVIVVSFLVCIAALGVPNWYVVTASGIVMFAAIFYSHGKW